jgi:hypothetical protein
VTNFAASSFRQSDLHEDSLESRAFSETSPVTATATYTATATAPPQLLLLPRQPRQLANLYILCQMGIALSFRLQTFCLFWRTHPPWCGNRDVVRTAILESLPMRKLFLQVTLNVRARARYCLEITPPKGMVIVLLTRSNDKGRSRKICSGFSPALASQSQSQPSFLESDAGRSRRRQTNWLASR